MRYQCSIYPQGFSLEGFLRGGRNRVLGTPVATLTVTGRSVREAAARAYVRGVGRLRAKVLREQLHAPRAVVASETDPRAIAAGLRKTSRGGSVCYQMDNPIDTWCIQVEPLGLTGKPAPRLRRSRLSPSVLFRLCQQPSDN
jgi:hypothetical protein